VRFNCGWRTSEDTGVNRRSARSSAVAAGIALVVVAWASPATSGADQVPVAPRGTGPDDTTTHRSYDVVSASRIPSRLTHRSAGRLVVEVPGSVTIGSVVPVRGRARLTTAPPAATGATEVGDVALLTEHVDGRRSVVDRAPVTRRGRFRLEAPPSTVAGRRDFTVTVRARRGRGSGPRLTDSVVVQTLPTPAVAPPPEAPAPEAGRLGDPSDWTFIGADPRLVTRWNPCTPVTWSYDPTGGYDGALDDMTVAIARVAAVSGLAFSYVGSTGGRITVAWSDAARTPGLAGTTVGLGGVSSFRVSPALNNGTSRQIVAGSITLDREESLLPGRSLTAQPDWGQVMVHEAMHAVGLGHARERTQVLFPYTAAKVFGAGGWAGLVAVGATHGCLVPIPGYERVAVTSTVTVE
jgi:hypothetical protein